jgi:hypothetical protein
MPKWMQNNWHWIGLLAVVQLLSACGGGGAEESLVSDSITVSGKARYEDRQYSLNGFTGITEFKAVRFAVVDLVESDGNVVATDTTDEQGNYQLSGTGRGLHLRILAQTGADAAMQISIKNHNGEVYAVTIEFDVTLKDQTVDMDLSLDSDIAGAFNMLDVFSAGSELINSLSTLSLPALNAYWQPHSSKYGTYFCTTNNRGGSCVQGKGIYVLGGTANGGDTDEYDDDVLYHEFSHYVENALGIQDSPGGTHYLTDNDMDLRLTWSEGWGGFFPAAVKTWLIANAPHLLSTPTNLLTTRFIDTYGSIAGISIDMANPNPYFCPGFKDCFVYSSSEIAVAKVMLGLQQQFGLQAVWNVYSQYMANGTSAPATIETFWDGWIAQRAPDVDETAFVQTVFNERQMYFQEDGFEWDNSHNINARKLDVCVGVACDNETHYLYTSEAQADKDIIAFDAVAGKSYYIETFDLSNGADTYIRLLNSNGDVVINQSGQSLVNDDRPGTVYCYPFDNPCRIHFDDLMLSSELNFTPSTSGVYYVEVYTSPNPHAGGGRYGTYKIQITDQD